MAVDKGTELSKFLTTLFGLMVAFSLLCGTLSPVAHAQGKAKSADPVQAALLGLNFSGPPAAGLLPPHSICFVPGTSAAQMQAIQQKQKFDNPNSLLYSPFRTANRWTSTANQAGGFNQGDPTLLTYSFVPDGTPIPGETNETSRLTAFLNKIYGNEAAWKTLFAQSTASWGQSTGIKYVLEPNDDGAAFPDSPGVKGVRGDVRIGGHFIDGPGSGVLAYDYFPNVSDMVIDTGQTDFYADTSNDSLGLRNVVTHEMGHGLGLQHVCPIDETKLMEPFVSDKFSGPQFDDVSAIQRLYGDASENNDTATTPTVLGALADGRTLRSTLSVDGKNDADYFQFTAPANRSITVSLRPEGTPYLEGAQNSDGSCSAGVTFDPRDRRDLGLEVFSTQNGVLSPLVTSNTAPAGQVETSPATNLTGSGPFQIRVFGDQTDELQRYILDVNIGPAVVAPDPTAVPTAGPTPTPAPPGPTPTPSPTAIRPIVDLNGPSPDGSTGPESPQYNGLDNVAQYYYQAKGVGKPGGPQVITPPETIVSSDISAGGVVPGDYIVEARVQLTPDLACPNGAGGQGTAPDNCNGQGKRDNEVLDLTAGEKKFLGDVGSGITSSYNVNTQILTLSGANKARYGRDSIRFLYEDALQNVTYENKLPIAGNTQGFNRTPNKSDRIVTYVVDTDNDDTNNIDGRFAVQNPGNPKQSKPAVLTLRFVEAQSLIVTTLQDSQTADPLDDPSARTDEQTSLREAIAYANTIVSSTRPDPTKPPVVTDPSIITFAANVRGTISLNNALPILSPFNGIQTAPISIQGPGARLLTVSGGNKGFRVFRTQNSFGVSALTISGGQAQVVTDANGNQTDDGSGGGIYNERGNLTVSACQISGNSAFNGGGISNIGGTLNVDLSTISGNNSSADGGGIYLSNFFQGSASNSTISNSTISGNSGGSGLYLATGTTDLSLSTVTNNSTAGVTVASGTATVAGTIISGNLGDNDVNGTGGGFTSGDYNLIGSGNRATSFTGNNDKVGASGNTARLGALANNGGNTDTHALFAGSPAIDSGNPSATPAPPANDQRGVGFARVFNGRIDIGSFEKQNNDPVTNVVITPRDPKTNDTLTANANSDTTNLNYVWTRTTRFGGTTTTQSGPSNTYDLSKPGFGQRGDTISVTVTATNATGTSTSTDSVVVLNTAPTFTLVITPDKPTTNQTITVKATSTDVDGDALAYTYVWKVTSTVNGQTTTRVLPQETGPTLNLAKAGNGDRDEVISVEVTGNDYQTNFNTGVTTGDAVTNTASVVVANSAPTATNIAFSAAPGQTVSILVQATDPDVKDTFTFALATNPTKGTAAFVKQDGRDVLVYTANANATGTDSFTFTATDNNTAGAGAPSNSLTSLPATATVTITGTPGPTPTPGPNPTPGPTPTPGPNPTPGPTPTPNTNRPPVVVDTSISTTREVPVVKGLGVFDPDAGDNESNITLKRVSGPRKGTGEISRDTDGKWKLFYKASGLYKGNDEVKFVATDKQGAVSNVATITINLFNTAPTARSTEMQVAAGGSADVGIFGQDVDRDALTFKSVGGPTKGTGEFRQDANGNTRFYYQNSQVAVGDDEVRFVAIDTSGKPSAEAILKIKVIGVFNRAPVANDVSGATTQNTPVAVPVSASDPDDANLPAGQTTPLTYKRVGGPTNGTGEIRLDGGDNTYKMFYTPRTGFVGTETIRYVAIDDKGAPSKPATITITVTSKTSALQFGPKPSAGSS